MTDAAVADESPDADSTYGGLLGAFPYAFRQSDSRLFRSYVVLGGLATVAVTVSFVLALIYLLGGTFGAQAGVFTFSRTFYILVALLVVAPLLAPVLLVARHHRRGHGDRSYDRALAAGGYTFLLSLYVMLVISAPAEYQTEPSGAIAPVVELLYGLPPIASLLPPLLASGLVIVLHRRRR